MIRYGALLPADDRGEIRFFRTSRALDAGSYDTPAEVGLRLEIAESAAALLMAIYPRISATQRRGQEELRSPGLEGGAAGRLADRMMDNLARRLAEDDRIWEDEPSWLGRVRRLPEPGQG